MLQKKGKKITEDQCMIYHQRYWTDLYGFILPNLQKDLVCQQGYKISKIMSRMQCSRDF